MIPPRNFPPGILKLVEYKNGEQFKVHAELSASTRNRLRIQQMRNDLLMVDSKMDLHIRENNA